MIMKCTHTYPVFFIDATVGVVDWCPRCGAVRIEKPTKRSWFRKGVWRHPTRDIEAAKEKP